MFPKDETPKDRQRSSQISRSNRSSDESVIVKNSSKLNGNERFELDATYAVWINRRYLKLLGIWKFDEDENCNYQRAMGDVSMILCCFGLWISVVPTGLYIVVIMKDSIGRVKLIGPWSFCLMATLKYIFLQYHRRDIERCMKSIEADWARIESESCRNIMLDYARYGHLVTIVCATLTYSGGIFFSILPFVVGKFSVDDSNENATAKALSLPSHFVFFDATETPAYAIIYTIQIAASFMMHSIAITSYNLAVVVVMHACGQLRIVMGKLSKLVDGDADGIACDSIDNRMSNLVGHHASVLRFISAAERMLREICLSDLGGCTLNLCLLGYFILLEWSSASGDAIAMLTYTILIFSFVFNIFSFCYIGELLTRECMKLGELSYMIDWYRLPSKQALGLCIIIAMAHDPVTLTAGGAMRLSFSCFTRVVNTSLGYLNMLRNLMV